jgi:WD40 repeat protein
VLQAEFVAASRRHSSRRQRLAVAASLAVAALAIGLSIFAVLQRNEATSQRNIAREQRSEAERQRDRAVEQSSIATSRALASAAVAQLDGDPELAVLLAAEALESSPTGEAKAAMVRALDNSFLLRALRGHEGWITSVGYSPDGQRVVSASEDGTARVWDLASGTSVVVDPEAGPLASAVLSPDGATLATAGEDGVIRLWDAATGEARGSLGQEGDGAVNDLRYEPDGRVLASTGDGELRFWDVEERRLLGSLGVDAWRIAFRPDGSLLAGIGSDRVLRLVPLAGEAKLEEVVVGDGGSVLGLSFHPGGRFVATAGSDGVVRFFDVRAGTEVSRIQSGTAQFASVAFSPDGNLVATAELQETVSLWNTGDGSRVRVYYGAKGAETVVAYSPTGNTIASGGQDPTVYVWSALDERVNWRLLGHTDAVRDVAYSPDGALIATASADGTVRLWQPGSESASRVIEAGRKLGTVAFSPDGAQVAAAGAGGSVSLWDAETGALESTLTGPSEATAAIAFGPSLLAAGSVDGSVYLWDTDVGGAPRALTGSAGQVQAVGFSPDGRRLAVGYAERTAAVFDLPLRLRDREPVRGVGVGEPRDLRVDEPGGSTGREHLRLGRLAAALRGDDPERPGRGEEAPEHPDAAEMGGRIRPEEDEIRALLRVVDGDEHGAARELLAERGVVEPQHRDPGAGLDAEPVEERARVADSLRPALGLVAELEHRPPLRERHRQPAVVRLGRADVADRDDEAEVAAEDELIGLEQSLPLGHGVAEASDAVCLLAHR